MSETRNLRKVRQGVVVSSANDKTIVVAVEERKPHPMTRATKPATATPFRSWRRARFPR